MHKNIDNDKLILDAEPTPLKQENEGHSGLGNTRELVPQEIRSKKTKIKTVTNVFNIKHGQGIHIGPKYTISVGKSGKRRDPNLEAEVLMTAEIASLLQRSDSITTEIIEFVSTHIGKNWKSVCRKLKYSDGQIFQFQELYQIYGIKEIMYNILNDWMENKPEEAIISTLVSILWNASEHDVVQMLAVELMKI
ncbi:hypothetical protein FQA39_LY04486 [Lamprigera yunnana]|nr:hypothetical protein FQA39_LY04486 [Lamprigera yunnana]